MAAALSSWVAHRPVTDAAAAGTGVAVLDWADREETAIGWRVVVRRGELVLPWTPSSAVDAATLANLGQLDLSVKKFALLLSYIAFFFFIVTSIYMIAEKASDVILADAKK